MQIFWISVGIAAQALFAARFLLQWIASERAGHSIVPIGFWVFSLLGGVLLLTYAVWRRDPVFIIGQASGLFVYFRNLLMIRRDHRKERTEVAVSRIAG